MRYALITTSQHAFGARYGFVKYEQATKKVQIVIPVCYKEEFIKQKSKLDNLIKKGDIITLRVNKYAGELLAELLEGHVTDSEMQRLKGLYHDDELVFTVLNSEEKYETQIPFTINDILYVPDTIEYLKDIK